MPNLLPMVFLVLASLALILTLLWLWQSVRLALVHAMAPPLKTIVSAERGALLAEKQNLLIALKDLEAERDSGKLSNEDFVQLNAQYRSRAVEVLRELDSLLAPHRAAAKSLIETAASGGDVAALDGSDPGTAPALRGGDPGTAPALRGGDPGTAPALRGGDPGTAPALRGGDPGTAPALRGGDPGTAPALRGGDPGTAPALRGGAGEEVPAADSGNGGVSAAAAVVVCPSCQAANDRDALFCKKCGTRMASEGVA